LAQNLGITVLKSSADVAELTRRTTEMEITCKVEKGPRRKLNIDTGINFLNHMVEMLSYYVEFNIDVVVKLPHFKLLHSMVEDTGLTLGRAFYEVAVNRMKETGIRGFGAAQCVMDEAFTQARVSMEGRAGCWITRDARRFGMVEDVQEEFMEAFFQGFAQRMMLTAQVDMIRGDDPHHLWECAFRSFGEALRQLLEPDPFRKGGVAGIKGTLD
jgi:imidazoleglycerol-phosphate dehydratase